MSHEIFDVFGDKCLPIIGKNINDISVIDYNGESILCELENYSISSDGYLKFLIHIDKFDKIYLINIKPYEYNSFCKSIEFTTYKILYVVNLKDIDIVYDYIHFLNDVNKYYCGVDIEIARRIYVLNLNGYLSKSITSEKTIRKNGYFWNRIF